MLLSAHPINSTSDVVPVPDLGTLSLIKIKSSHAPSNLLLRTCTSALAALGFKGLRRLLPVLFAVF